MRRWLVKRGSVPTMPFARWLVWAPDGTLTSAHSTHAHAVLYADRMARLVPGLTGLCL